MEAHRFFAFLLTALGRYSEAITEIQTAEQPDPLSSLVQSDFAQALYCARNYEQAEGRLKRAIELDSLNFGAYGRLGYVYGEMGSNADAISSLERSESLQGGAAAIEDTPPLSHTYMRGWAGVRRRCGFSKSCSERKMVLFSVRGAASAWAALGNEDEAFRLLFNAVEKRDNLLIFTKVDPPFDSLRSDPRWQELLRPMNFPGGPAWQAKSGPLKTKVLTSDASTLTHCEPSFFAHSITFCATARPISSPASMSLRK